MALEKSMITFQFHGSVRAMEIIDSNSYSILTKQGELITEKSSSSIYEKFRFPIIRRIEDELILITETRSAEKEKNAKIYNLEGKLKNEFEAGDAINDILAYDRKLVISYFDEGIMQEKRISKEGLAIFHKSGKFLWGFNSNSKYQIWDCYHIVKTGADKVLFFGYGKFPMLELNINSQTFAEVNIPIESGIDSLSCSGNKIYWRTSTQVFSYERSNNRLETFQKLDKQDKRILVGDQLVQITKDGIVLEKIDKLED